MSRKRHRNSTSKTLTAMMKRNQKKSPPKTTSKTIVKLKKSTRKRSHKINNRQMFNYNRRVFLIKRKFSNFCNNNNSIKPSRTLTISRTIYSRLWITIISFCWWTLTSIKGEIRLELHSNFKCFNSNNCLGSNINNNYWTNICNCKLLVVLEEQVLATV